jgi:T-complex protein 1 subunit alpha
MAVSEYANALLVIPKCLSVNAAKDATELIGQLRAYHYQHQENKKDFKHYGLDLFNGKVVDNRKAGVLEPTLSKIKMLKSATEAAISILRIDDMIKLDPVQNEKDGHGH